MAEKQETQLTFADPEARMIPLKRSGFMVCYNVQTATDHRVT